MVCHWRCERTLIESTEISGMHLLISWRSCFVIDDAISALKHFRCDACDRLKQPPSKRKVAVNHAETFNDIVSMDVNFWKITFKESPRVKTTEHRVCCIRYAHCDSEADGRGKIVEPTPAEAHWQMGQVENNARYLHQVGYRIVEDIDMSQSDFQTMLDELTDAKNSLVHHKGYMPRQWCVRSDSQGARSHA